MRAAFRFGSAAVVLLGALACGDGRAAPDDVALPGVPAPLFAVGRADGAEWESFGHVAHVAFDAADNLYVLDEAAATVYVYGPDGRFRHRIGRRGGGPGELTAPMQVAADAGGAVVVSDVGKRAFSVFDAAGRHLRDLPFAGRALGGMELRAHPAGGFVTLYQPPPSAPADTARIRIVWHALDPARPPRTLRELPVDSGVAGMVSLPGQRAFLPRLAWGVLPDGGVAVAREAGYRVELTSSDGRAVRTVERPIAPRPVTEQDREREREERMAALEEDGAEGFPAAARALLAAQARRLRFADVMPVVRELAVDPAGGVWVRRAAPDGGDRLDRSAPDGRYLGTVAGDRLPLAISRTGRAAFVEEDELHVQRVRVVQLPPAWLDLDSGKGRGGV